MLSHAPLAAQEIEQEQSIEFETERVEVLLHSYEEVIKTITNRAENINNPVFYKDWQAADTTLEKVIKFSNLTTLQKDVLYLIQAEELERYALQTTNEVKGIRQFVAAIDNEEVRKKYQEALKPLDKLNLQLWSVRTKLARKRLAMVKQALEAHKDNAMIVLELKKYQDIVLRYNKTQSFFPEIDPKPEAK